MAVTRLAFPWREEGKMMASVVLGITTAPMEMPGSREGIFPIFSLVVHQFCKEDTDPTSQMRTVRLRESQNGIQSPQLIVGELGSDKAV